MNAPLKLSAIEQEHLQELYDAAKVGRDELPYTPTFDQLVQGFQDRTFKNAGPEMVFAAILKYVRTGAAPAAEPAPTGPTALTEEQLKHLKPVLSRHMRGGKILPYSDAFTAARTEFNKLAGTDVSEHDFWRAIVRAQGARRRPPPARKKTKAPAAADDDDDE